ncbi:MAG: ERCC4 domain-containing protein [Vicinamibacterales bacterium]
MILVDYRSGSKELIAPLRKAGLPVEESDLDSADLAFCGRGEKDEGVLIGIEFKTLGELMQSLRSGRLQGHQLLKMQSDYRFKYLFVEGIIRFDAQGQLMRRGRRGLWVPMPGAMSIAELLKRVERLQIAFGLLPRYYDIRANTLKAIEMLYRTWTDKAQDKAQSHIAIYEPAAIVPINPKRQMLCKLPGVSLKVSAAAKKHFGTVRKAVNASADQWADVATVDDHGATRRLGRKSAEKIVHFVTTE